MGNKLGFGIMGLGTISKRFAAALAKSDVAELVAVAARDEARAKDFAEGISGEIRPYGDYAAMLADPKVQAVYIGTVNTTHAELAKLCINAGKAVLCEKPFFMSISEAEEVAGLAREKGVLLMEGMWTRTLPAFLKAKEWVEAGKIGKPRLLRAAFCFSMPLNEATRGHRLWSPELGGGAMLDVGVYSYMYATGLFGTPDEVQVSKVMASTGVDRSVSMTLRYERGILAECLASIGGYMDDTAIIGGNEGFIRQYRFWGSRRVELVNGGGEVVETFEDPEEEGFVHEIAHFASIFKEKKTESPLVPLSATLDFARRL